MSKIVERVVISLVCLNVVLQLFIYFSFIYPSFKEVIFIPIRPPLTHPDPQEVLLVKESINEGGKEAHKANNYSPQQILESIDLLKKEKEYLLNKEQIYNMLPYFKKIHYYRKKINYLNKNVEDKKKELELACSEVAKILKWDQLDFAISDIDLLTLKIYEFPYWLKLPDKVKIKAELTRD